MRLCGVTGWRLPTIEELRSLLDYNSIFSTNAITLTTSVLAAYDTEYFAGDVGAHAFIWSSTTVANKNDEALGIRFNNRMEEGRIKGGTTLNGIRLVNESILNSVQSQDE